MKKLWLFFVCISPGIIYAQVPGTATDLGNAAAKALAAVVRIQVFLSDSSLSLRPNLATLQGTYSSRPNSGDLIGSASGVLLTAAGDIITNAHILEGDSVVVILPDRRAYRALLIGTDDESDLALLKIPGTNFPFLELGDPAMVRVGDPVLAVGNPLELTSTVTSGILSARFRSLDDSEQSSSINSYLQTDAASNEGMSGSALVDREGKLIGINSAIVSPTGIFAGYAFAIPAGIVKKVWHDLAKYGEARHAYPDISFEDMDANHALKLHTKTVYGVWVNNVQPGGAGERAGLRKNDILLQMNRQQLSGAAQLRELLAQHNPGDSVMFLVERQELQRQIEVILSTGPGKSKKAISVNGQHKVAWPIINTTH